MKELVFVAAIALVSSGAAFGQTGLGTVPPSDTFEIGSRYVRVPAPEGFTQIGRRHKHILSVQVAAEPASNEIIALHLPTDQLPKYKADFVKQPDFFTKVSVPRVGREENISPATFLAVGSYIEKEFEKLTDPRGRAALAEQHYISKNLTELLNMRTKVKWDQPVNLGVFDRGDRAHSTLALVSLSANKTPYTFLATVSVVHVNGRLVYVYVYKSNPVDVDLEMMREFTRKWTASIVAANEELTAKRR